MIFQLLIEVILGYKIRLALIGEVVISQYRKTNTAIPVLNKSVKDLFHTKTAFVINGSTYFYRMKKWLFLFLIGCCVKTATAQKDSICNIRISVLTCAPGDQLYSLFGHTALRITDTASRQDLIYNWGTFDFTQPGFYTNFMRGKLLYYVSAWTMPEFMYEYQASGRAVYEQVLSLNCADKKRVLDAVAYNLLEENIYYKYDFLLDNCTTRIRDIILKNLQPSANTKSVTAEGTTHRNLLHYYLDRGNQPWSKLGIDILLGSKLDEPVTIQSSFFLPEFFMKGLSYASVEGKSVVPETKTILTGNKPIDSGWKHRPLIYLSIVSLLLFICCKLRPGKVALGIDSLLMVLTGLLGILLLFMWLGTDHTVCQNNWNLLWAFPLNLPAGFLLKKKSKPARIYFLAMAVITGVLLAGWFWWPQQLNIALVPLVILMLNRFFYHASKNKA